MAFIDDRKVLAHRIISDGKTYAMSVAEISADRQSVEIKPFELECAGTVFVSGTVEVARTALGLQFYILTSTSSSNSRK